jgi:hypothetical protein
MMCKPGEEMSLTHITEEMKARAAAMFDARTTAPELAQFLTTPAHDPLPTTE